MLWVEVRVTWKVVVPLETSVAICKAAGFENI